MSEAQHAPRERSFGQQLAGPIQCGRRDLVAAGLQRGKPEVERREAVLGRDIHRGAQGLDGGEYAAID